MDHEPYSKRPHIIHSLDLHSPDLHKKEQSKSAFLRPHYVWSLPTAAGSPAAPAPVARGYKGPVAAAGSVKHCPHLS
jgi:hypothetical protein